MRQHPRMLICPIVLLPLVLLCSSLAAGCTTNKPVATAVSAPSDSLATEPATPAAALPQATTSTAEPSATPTSQPPLAVSATPRPLTVVLPPDLLEEFKAPLEVALDQAGLLSIGDEERPVVRADGPEGASAVVKVASLDGPGTVLAERFFAAVVPFDTTTDDATLDELRARWSGNGGGPLFLTPGTSVLSAVLGPSPNDSIPFGELLSRLQADRNAIGIVPFDELDPRFKVLSVDGLDVLSNGLKPEQYPLAVALKVTGEEEALAAPLLDNVIEPRTNRDPKRLTTLIMTGVTAMSRDTALRMEEKGVLYPALVISDTLAAADITHVSNEVPFLDDCKVNASADNLVLCSNTSYWATLQAIGTDIVGLSGNHVNDFGYNGAQRSIKFYRDAGIPIYGSGLNLDEACAPLMWEHNDNTFAFIAALAYWPETAWASADNPGACYYYDNKDRIAAMVKELADKVDVVAVELQYYETYRPYPTVEQVAEFREVRKWGADIVTGVQSHVPQAMEPYGQDDAGGPGIIVYGLGNLFFDQMWSWETRTELYARHTIYDGRLLNTEILTGVLEDYAQPRWATPEERTEILSRIFKAAPKRP